MSHKIFYAEKKDNGNIIIVISTLVAFIVGIFCGLLPYHCIRSLLTRRSTTRPLQETQLARMQKEELAETELYEEVNTSDARYKVPHPIPNTHVELEENVAYGHVHY
jgi:hypothetical protein